MLIILVSRHSNTRKRVTKMKKIAKKLMSLVLAVSALCILFAFQASAISTTCQECGGSNIDYIPLGNVGEPNAPLYHHEVYCNDCGHSVDEEDCEFNNYSTTSHWCACGQTNSHDYQMQTGNYGHIYSCQGCSYYYFTAHTYSNGYCTICGYPQ